MNKQARKQSEKIQKYINQHVQRTHLFKYCILKNSFETKYQRDVFKNKSLKGICKTVIIAKKYNKNNR